MFRCSGVQVFRCLGFGEGRGGGDQFFFREGGGPTFPGVGVQIRSSPIPNLNCQEKETEL